MPTTSEARALPFFVDLIGRPLESGSIYIGQAGRDPVAYPVTVTSDAGGTVVLQQPIRTTHGRAVSAGAQVHMFCPTPYSITVLDSAGRVTYTSLNETDPSVVSLGTSTVQSASSLADLRSRSGSATNQVWVDGFGMYIYNPTDTISPENIPFVVVGNDGARYDLGMFDANLGFARVSKSAPTYGMEGCWISWNDDGANGFTYFTNNRGTGSGGFLFRTMQSDGTTQTGSVQFDSVGNVTATGDVRATGNLQAGGGIVSLNSSGTRSVQYDGVKYTMPLADLYVNGSKAITEATLSAELAGNNSALAVGSYTIGTSTMPTPGTWTLIATISSVYLWLRTA
jgi:hypothetical protein